MSGIEKLALPLGPLSRLSRFAGLTDCYHTF